MSKDLLFYDIEVFEYDSLAVFKNADGSVRLMMWNDTPNRPAAIAGLLGRFVLVGYNNYHYDDLILTYMLDPLKRDEDIKSLNDDLIAGRKIGVKVDPRIESIDTMQQIGIDRISLKQIEGNLGMSIEESRIPFDIDRPLTQDERRSTEFYCCHDVDAAIEVYRLRKQSYFDVKENLLAMLPKEQNSAARWNTTTISAKLLESSDRYIWSEHRVPDRFWRKNKYIPEVAWEIRTVVFCYYIAAAVRIRSEHSEPLQRFRRIFLRSGPIILQDFETTAAELNHSSFRRLLFADFCFPQSRPNRSMSLYGVFRLSI